MDLRCADRDVADADTRPLAVGDTAGMQRVAGRPRAGDQLSPLPPDSRAHLGESKNSKLKFGLPDYYESICEG